MESLSIPESVYPKNGYQFSSANSINIGRLLPQIVYYFYTYGRLLADNKIKLGDKINFSVPTGNFGDILAGFFAKKLGLPINKLLCASNENNVLTEFFKTGTYNKKRDFKVTNSPSMDILVSSNLERLLFYATNGNAALVAEWMNQLEKEGKYGLVDIRGNLIMTCGADAIYSKTSGGEMSYWLLVQNNEIDLLDYLHKNYKPSDTTQNTETQNTENQGNTVQNTTGTENQNTTQQQSQDGQNTAGQSTQNQGGQAGETTTQNGQGTTQDTQGGVQGSTQSQQAVDSQTSAT